MNLGSVTSRCKKGLPMIGRMIDARRGVVWVVGWVGVLALLLAAPWSLRAGLGALGAGIGIFTVIRFAAKRRPETALEREYREQIAERHTSVRRARRLPCVLVIGPAGVGKSSLIHGALGAKRFGTESRVHLTAHGLVVELSSDDPRLFEELRALRRVRGSGGVNSALVCIADAEPSDEQQAGLRHALTQIEIVLGVRLPVRIVATHVDRVAGGSGFLPALARACPAASAQPIDLDLGGDADAAARRLRDRLAYLRELVLTRCPSDGAQRFAAELPRFAGRLRERSWGLLPQASQGLGIDGLPVLGHSFVANRVGRSLPSEFEQDLLDRYCPGLAGVSPGPQAGDGGSSGPCFAGSLLEREWKEATRPEWTRREQRRRGLKRVCIAVIAMSLISAIAVVEYWRAEAATLEREAITLALKSGELKSGDSGEVVNVLTSARHLYDPPRWLRSLRDQSRTCLESHAERSSTLLRSAIQEQDSDAADGSSPWPLELDRLALTTSKTWPHGRAEVGSDVIAAAFALGSFLDHHGLGRVKQPGQIADGTRAALLRRWSASDENRGVLRAAEFLEQFGRDEGGDTVPPELPSQESLDAALVAEAARLRAVIDRRSETYHEWGLSGFEPELGELGSRLSDPRHFTQARTWIDAFCDAPVAEPFGRLDQFAKRVQKKEDTEAAKEYLDVRAELTQRKDLHAQPFLKELEELSRPLRERLQGEFEALRSWQPPPRGESGTSLSLPFGGALQGKIVIDALESLQRHMELLNDLAERASQLGMPEFVARVHEWKERTLGDLRRAQRSGLRDGYEEIVRTALEDCLERDGSWASVLESPNWRRAVQLGLGPGEGALLDEFTTAMMTTGLTDPNRLRRLKALVAVYPGPEKLGHFFDVARELLAKEARAALQEFRVDHDGAVAGLEHDPSSRALSCDVPWKALEDVFGQGSQICALYEAVGSKVDPRRQWLHGGAIDPCASSPFTQQQREWLHQAVTTSAFFFPADPAERIASVTFRPPRWSAGAWPHGIQLIVGGRRWESYQTSHDLTWVGPDVESANVSFEALSDSLRIRPGVGYRGSGWRVDLVAVPGPFALVELLRNARELAPGHFLVARELNFQAGAVVTVEFEVRFTRNGEAWQGGLPQLAYLARRIERKESVR
ncbi:MAG: hypothetical protein AB7O52_03645 [Planctomycetota bacterium]